MLNKERNELIMNNFSITEKYALCILKERKNLYENGDIFAYLVLSMTLEMMLDGNLDIIDKDKIVLNNKEPEDDYNKQLYNIIGEMKKDKISLNEVIPLVCTNNKYLHTISTSLKNKMVDDGLISLDNKKELLGDKEVINANESILNNIIENVKLQITGNNTLKEDEIVFISLLNYTSFLKDLFDKNEREILKNKLKDFEGVEKVKISQSIIEELETTYLLTIVTNLI